MGHYLFYTKYNDWMVGKKYHCATGILRTSQPGLVVIPRFGWDYRDRSKKEWILDDGLQIEGELISMVPTMK